MGKGRRALGGRLSVVSGLVLAASLAGGCLPNRVVLDLAGSDGKLAEREVMSDAGGGSKIAMIDVDGLLSHAPGPAIIAGSGNTVDELVSRLDKAEKDTSVRAVILRINSPGGTVAASDTMYREIMGFRERSRKPVVVSMAEIATSGGYYIALAADRIIAQPSSITGSIGVLIQTVNFSKGMAMIGIEGRAVTSGANKDLANPLAPVREEQYRVLQGTVDEFYGAFRALVAERRTGIDAARLDEIADGRVFTGMTALREGLVDANGGLREAFAEAKSLAGVERARLVKYHIEGRVPASPYATASAPDHSPAAAGVGAGTQVNLVQVNIDRAMLPSAGFYYLWTP